MMWHSILAVLLLAALLSSATPRMSQARDDAPPNTADSGHATAGPEAARAGSQTDSTAGYTVAIDRLTVTSGRVDDTLDIVFDGHGEEFAGFVLKIACNSRFLDIIDVLPGDVIDSCGWEFFRPLQLNTMGKSDKPRSLWQITALSKMSADTTQPVCLGLDRPASVARLVVSSAHVSIVPDTTAPIYFYWEDCRDNTVSDATGEHLCVSRRVVDFFPFVSDTARNVFPTRFGAPRQCINPTLRNAPTRSVDFDNGGVRFQLEVGGGPGDSTGIDTLE